MNSLHQKLTRLALTTMSHNLDQVLTDTSKQNLSLAAALESLVDMELDARRSRAVERRFLVPPASARVARSMASSSTITKAVFR